MYSYNISADNPNGIKIIENGTCTLEAFTFPRQLLSDFNKLSESSKPGIYILYNTADKNEVPYIYIGQSETSIYNRLLSHNRNKDFWNYAIVFISKGEYLNGTHAKYIEAELIERATECKIFNLDNSTGSKKPPLSKSDKNNCIAWIEQIMAIVGLLGLSFFYEIDTYGLPPVEVPEPDPPVDIDNELTGRQKLISVCERYIKEFGAEKFNEIVLNHEILKKMKRPLFSVKNDYKEIYKSSIKQLSSGIYLFTNLSNDSINRQIERLNKIFEENRK